MRDLPYAEENAFALDVIMGGRRVAYIDSPGVYYEGPFSPGRLYELARRQTIATRLIQHAYGPVFGIARRRKRVDMEPLWDVAMTPCTAAGIAYRFAVDSRYHIGSRALSYDLCALRAPLGRLAGTLSWRQFLATLEVNHEKLIEAEEKTVAYGSSRAI